MQRLMLPALIVNSHFGALLTIGYKPPRGETIYKRAECRGTRCFTTYRGAVAIFASRSYNRDAESQLVEFLAHAQGFSKISERLNIELRGWLQHTHGWSYRLLGFVRLTNAVKAQPLLERADDGDAKAAKEIRRLAVAATDYLVEYADGVGVYLETEPLHATDSPTLAPDLAPLFSDSCTGCLARPPHKAAACHVNFQTVSLAASIVPDHAKKEIKPWPLQK